MHFLNLPEFDPASGVNTDNHNKFPFISSAEGLFEPNIDPFNYKSQSFPFEKIELDHENYFYVSEPNLELIFQPGIARKEIILLENIRPIYEEYINELKTHFYKGYQAGIANFKNELGLTYNSLSIAHQKEMLIAFMMECHTYLYFEGFAIPQVLYSLGYIQANLVLAYKEYQNLKGLTEQTANKPNTAKKNQPAKSKVAPTNVKPVYSKTEIKYPISDIITLWLVLLDIHKCSSLAPIQEFKTSKEIHALLGSMFKDISGKQTQIPDSAHHYYELPPNYQVILNLLMHATYKLNYIYTKLPFPPYAKLLKDTFSPYHGIEVGHIGSNITKKISEAITILQQLQDSQLAKKALEILMKIPQYAPYFKRR
jgi:hypothetical protein